MAPTGSPPRPAGTASSPDLAILLNNLSLGLADLGRREDALAAIQEAGTYGSWPPGSGERNVLGEATPRAPRHPVPGPSPSHRRARAASPNLSRSPTGRPEYPRKGPVVGQPDPVFGEQPVAFVTLRHGRTVASEDLIEHCRVSLARYKVPRAVYIDEEARRRTRSGRSPEPVLRERLRQADPAEGTHA